MRDRVTLAFQTLLALAALTLAALPLAPSLQRAFARTHHLAPASAAEWAVVAPLPKMYGFAHEVRLSREPITLKQLELDDRARTGALERVAVNHYPTKVLRFLPRDGEPWYAAVVTSYRGRRLVTRFRVTPVGAGVRIERLE